MLIDQFLKQFLREVIREELEAFKTELQAEKQKPKKVDKRGASELTGRPISYFEKIGAKCSRYGIVEKGVDGKNYFPVQFLEELEDRDWDLDQVIGNWAQKKNR